MTSIAMGRMAPFHASDRNFFLLILAIIWAVLIAGFVPDVIGRYTGKHVPYAIVVHVHAVAYVGWMALLTTQMSLIRARRVELHKRLGMIAVGLIPTMFVLGIWAAVVMDHRELNTPDGDDGRFLIVQLIDALNFAVIASAGMLLRRDLVAHKRLMLLATVVISHAGSGRWLGPALQKLVGTSDIGVFISTYFGDVALVAALLIHDLATRKRLHPAVATAAAFGLFMEALAAFLYNLPAWKPIALWLIQR
jgi:uncharacterized membrane protein YozB (DUF420 family)